MAVCAALLLTACTPAAHSADAPPTPTPPPACLKAVDNSRCFGPAQIRQQYGFDAVLRGGTTGKGRTIAVIVSFGSPTIREDLHAFDRAFGLPDPTLQIRAPLGTQHPQSTGWVGETTLDVEWAHAIAPAAKILLLTAPVDETEGVQGLPEFLKLEQYALAHHADVISQSWAATEDTLLDQRGRAMVAKFHRFYSDATKAGMTMLGGSGDDGAAGLDLSLKHFYPYRVTQWPASDPLVLGVGGTHLVSSDTGTDEVAWVGSGGGFSKLYAEPAYQRTLGSNAQQLLHGRRGVPDVAMNASHESPILTYHSGHWWRVSGTSASTPMWAGLVALADSKAKRRLGDLHPAIYRITHSSRYSTDLRDITVGTIKDPAELAGKGEPLHAGPGWDPATGVGTPRAAALIRDLIAKK
ncbi:MAG: S53 family peptidase [Chloroflexota bacterium]